MEESLLPRVTNICTTETVFSHVCKSTNPHTNITNENKAVLPASLFSRNLLYNGSIL